MIDQDAPLEGPALTSTASGHVETTDGESQRSASPLPGLADEGVDGLFAHTTGRVARNAFFLIAQPLLLNLISLAVTGYIARSLGVEDFGRLNYAFAISALFASLAGLGIGTVTVRDLVRGAGEAPDRYVGRTLTLRLLSGTLAYVGLATGVIAGGLLPGAPHLVLLAGTTIFPTLLTISIEDVFRAREQMHHVARVRLISGLVLTCASVLALVLGGRLGTLVAIYTGASFLTLALAARTLVRRFFVPRPGFSWGFTRRVVGQGTIFFAGGILGSLSQRIDRVILERMQGAFGVGQFSAGNTLVEKLAIIPEGLGGAVYPALTGLVDRDRRAARQVLAHFIVLAAMVGLPAALGGTLIAEPLIRLIFGRGFDDAVLVFSVAIWVLPAWCLSQVLSYAMVALHREKQGLAIAAGATGLLVLGNLLLVPFFGPAGSAAALSGSQWVATVLFFALAWHHYGALVPWRAALRILVGLAALAAAVVPLAHLPLPLPLAAGAVAYSLVVWPLARETLRHVRQHRRQGSLPPTA